MEAARVQIVPFVVAAALGVVLFGCGTPPSPASPAPEKVAAPGRAEPGPSGLEPAAAATGAPPVAAADGRVEARDSAPDTRVEARDAGLDSRTGARDPARDARTELSDAAAGCRAPGKGQLAWLSCDGARIDVAQPIELHPARAVPTEPTRSVLAAVGDLLRRRQDVLFVRIEVHATEPTGQDAARQRAQIAQAQERADAILQQLWRKQRVSAERLEAVGYPFDPKRSGAAERWHVVLVVVQRAAR